MSEFNFDIDKSLKLLFKVQSQEVKKKVLLDKGKIVYLQIRLFKTPFVRGPKRKFLRLRHSLYGDEPEICLFVPNRKTGVNYKKTTDESIDFSVDYYTDLLEKYKIKDIKTVMPLKQLRSEYSAYELRRKLAHRFDLFLCKNSLLYNHRFLTALGKAFHVTNKEPLGIAFPKSEEKCDLEFEQNIKRAIYSSSFYIKPYSDNYAIPFGILSQSETQLRENLKAVLDQIFSCNMIPGGFKNVRAIYIWPSQSKTIPLYFCPSLPENLGNPRLRRKKKGLRTVQGEISTQPGKKITVMPNGDVFVTESNLEPKKNILSAESKIDDDDDDSFEEGSEIDDSENRKNRTNIMEKEKESEERDRSESESESESDEKIEEIELRLLGKKREAELENDFHSIKRRKNEKEHRKKNLGKVANEKKLKKRKNNGKRK